MTYEIIQRVGTIEYTVRGPDHLAVAELLRRARALVEDVSEADAAFAEVRMRATQEDRNEVFYPRQLRRMMDDLSAAINLVQANQSFFGGQPGADAVKIIGDFFCRWATEKLASSDAEQQALANQFVATLPKPKTKPWVPDDNGAWVEVGPDFDPKAFFPRARRIEFLLADERERRQYTSTNARSDQVDSNADRARVRSPLIVAYKVVSR